MKAVQLFWHNVAWGFPVIWSARTAWAWRNGPSPELVAAHRRWREASAQPPRHTGDKAHD